MASAERTSDSGTRSRVPIHVVSLGETPLERVLDGFDAVIDVRSPSEYAEDHIPGAMPLAVLDDEERARVGTMYKRVSPFDARKLGAALVSKNIAHHLETVLAGRPREWRPLVYCWRGGKRSGSFAHVLREIGWDAITLEGGYRAYRRHVVAELERLPAAYRFRVVHGATGSGKSRLLGALARAGAQVLDLEDIAAHRGSVLGDLPDRPQPSQKAFESVLRRELAALDPARVVYVEGESRKIGELQVPAALILAMRRSECVVVEAGVATRVELLCSEYRHFLADPDALGTQLDCLVALHGRERIAEWKSLAVQGAWGPLVERLLVEHYDPAYRRSAQGNYPALADAPRFRLDAATDPAFTALAQAIVGTDAANNAPAREAA